jgi:hypothetical protein
VYLLLANGEFYRVNNDLIGRDGSFGPVLGPQSAMDMKSAWLAGQACGSTDGLPEAFAVKADGHEGALTDVTRHALTIPDFVRSSGSRFLSRHAALGTKEMGPDPGFRCSGSGVQDFICLYCLSGPAPAHPGD